LKDKEQEEESYKRVIPCQDGSDRKSLGEREGRETSNVDKKELEEDKRVRAA
jgi:hypothetical protein